MAGRPLNARWPPHLVAVLDVGWQGSAQRLEFPDGLVTIELRHIIAKRAFELAIGLRMLGRGMDEPDAQVATEGLQQFPAKRTALVKHHPLGMTCHWRMAVHKAAMVVRGSIWSKRSQNT